MYISVLNVWKRQFSCLGTILIALVCVYKCVGRRTRLSVMKVFMVTFFLSLIWKVCSPSLYNPSSPDTCAASRHPREPSCKLPDPKGGYPATPGSPRVPANFTAPISRGTACHANVMVAPTADVIGPTAGCPVSMVAALRVGLTANVAPVTLRVTALIRQVTSEWCRMQCVDTILYTVQCILYNVLR